KSKPVPFYFNLMKYSAVPVTAAIAVIIFTSFIHNQNVKTDFVSENIVTSSVQNDENAVHEDAANDFENEEIVASETTSSNTAYETSEDDFSHSTAISSELTLESENENTPSFTFTVPNAESSPVTSDKKPSATSVTVTTAAVSVSTTGRTYNSITTMTTARTTANVTRTTAITTEPPEFEIVTTTPIYTIPAPIVTTTTDHFEDVPSCDPDYDIKDLRVTPPVIYSKTGNIIDVTSAFEDNATDSYSWQLSATMADAAVYGVIDKTFYTSIEGMPYIQADIFIENSLMNYDFGYGDMISVYIPGGFMSMNDFLTGNSWYESELGDMSEEEIQDSTVYIKNGNYELIKAGKSYLFLLQTGFGNMPSGAFTLCNEMDIFTKMGKRYYCAKNSGISFLQNELTKYFN
ncbi:MAG: hypothetical protein PUB66_06300, partial [Oscillospiraceae bacterium]|nr:hypothetical protein [Oscillospiraceae bacterium]